jgi:hypothetical protein
MTTYRGKCVHRREQGPADPDGGLCGLANLTRNYVALAEFSTVRGKFGLPVERDLHFDADKPLSAYADEALASTRRRRVASLRCPGKR